MEKSITKYGKIYKTALRVNSFPDIDMRVASFQKRLRKMYLSEAFQSHNIYATMDVYKVYAVIAMCLELKQENLSGREIIEIINSGFANLKKMLAAVEKLIDALPWAYAIARKWNISDHNNRVKDGSITYDYFHVTDRKIEYRISKCMYIEMFEYYGIRSLCKIFCLTDESAYANLTRHVEFIRHSDLSDGNCCYDEVIDKNVCKR